MAAQTIISSNSNHLAVASSSVFLFCLFRHSLTSTFFSRRLGHSFYELVSLLARYCLTSNEFDCKYSSTGTMISKTVLIAALIAYVEARFGQEQVPIDAISQVQGGNPGDAATIAGAAVSDLLGGANACAKVFSLDSGFSMMETNFNSSNAPTRSSPRSATAPMLSLLRSVW